MERGNERTRATAVLAATLPTSSPPRPSIAILRALGELVSLSQKRGLGSGPGNELSQKHLVDFIGSR
jgi:hypothetical protein